jgi:hypothetical protein
MGGKSTGPDIFINGHYWFSRGSIVVEHSPRHPKVKGSHTEIVVYTHREYACTGRALHAETVFLVMCDCSMNEL